VSDLPPANWYPDPEVPGQQRYWDGTQWTEHRAPGVGAQPQGAAWGAASDTQVQGGQPAWGQQPQQAWGQQAQPASGSTNGLAITSLVVAILSFFLAFVAIGGLGGVVAVVLGVMGLRRIRESNGAQGGRGLAISGIVVGGVSVLIAIAMFVVFVFVTTAAEQGGFSDFFECVEQEARTGQDLDC
jgi:hypothetical protein